MLKLIRAFAVEKMLKVLKSHELAQQRQSEIFSHRKCNKKRLRGKCEKCSLDRAFAARTQSMGVDTKRLSKFRHLVPQDS